MGKEYAEINERIERWLSAQHVFFVATAPLADDGHVNCSPKGLNGLRVLGPHQLAYGDVGGSGIETVAHIKENGRLTIMLCAFDGPPKIFRFYGTGSVVEPGHASFDDLAAQFPELPALRNIVVLDVEKIVDSCGYGVPVYDYKQERDSMHNYLANKSQDDLVAYRREKNAVSIDGLKGLEL